MYVAHFFCTVKSNEHLIHSGKSAEEALELLRSKRRDVSLDFAHRVALKQLGERKNQ